MHKSNFYWDVTKFLKIYTRRRFYQNESNKNTTTQVTRNYSVFKDRSLSILPINKLAINFLRNDQSSIYTKKYKSYWYVPSVSGYQTYKNANVLQNILQRTDIVVPNKYLIFKRNYPSCGDSSATIPQRVRIKEYKKRKSKLPPLCKACPRKVQLKEQKTFFKKLWSKLGFGITKTKQPTNAPKGKQKAPDSQSKNEESVPIPAKTATCTAECEDDVRKTDSALAFNIASKLAHEVKSPQEVCTKEKIPKSLHPDTESPNVELKKSECPKTEILKAKSEKVDILKAENQKVEDAKAVLLKVTSSDVKSSTEQCLKPAPSIDEKVANLCKKYNLDNIWLSDNIHPKKCFNNISTSKTNADDSEHRASTSFSGSRSQPAETDVNLDVEIVRLKPVNKGPGTSYADRERTSVDHSTPSRKGEKNSLAPSNSYIKLMSVDKSRRSVARKGKQEYCDKNAEMNFTESVTGHQEHRANNETNQLNEGTKTSGRPENVGKMFIPEIKKLYESTDINNDHKESNKLNIIKNRNLQTKPNSFDTAEKNEVPKDRSAKQSSKYNTTQDSPKRASRKVIQENDSTLKSSEEQPFRHEVQNEFNSEETLNQNYSHQDPLRREVQNIFKSDKGKIKNNIHQEPFRHEVQNISNPEETKNKNDIHQEPFKHLTMYEMLQKSQGVLTHKLSKNSVIDAVKTNNENIKSGKTPKETASNRNNKDNLDNNNNKDLSQTQCCPSKSNAGNPSQIPYEVYSECTYNIHPTRQSASKNYQIPAPKNDTVKLEENTVPEKIIDDKNCEKPSVKCDVRAQITKVAETASQYQNDLNVAASRVNPNTIYKSNTNTQLDTTSYDSKDLNSQSPSCHPSKSHDQHVGQTNMSIKQITSATPRNLKINGLDNNAKCESSPDFKEILSCKLNITQEDSLNEVKVMNKDIESKQYQLRLTLSESNIDGQPVRRHTRESQNVDNIHKIQVKLDSSEATQSDRTPRRIVNELKAIHDRTRNFTTSAHQTNEEFQLANGGQNRLRESYVSSMVTKNCKTTDPYNTSSKLQGFNENKALSPKKCKSLLELPEKKSTNNLLDRIRSNEKCTADSQITEATGNNKTNSKKYCNELVSSKNNCNENKIINNGFCEVGSPCNTKQTENKISQAPKESKPPDNFELSNVQSISELGDFYKNILTSMLKLCQQTKALVQMPEQNDNYKNFQDMEVKYSIENCNHAIMNTESKAVYGAQRNVSERSSVNTNNKNCTIKCLKSKKISKVVHRMPVHKQGSTAQAKLRKQNAKSSKLPTQYIVDSTMLTKFINLIKSDLVQSDVSEKYTEMSGDKVVMHHETAVENNCFKSVPSGDGDKKFKINTSPELNNSFGQVGAKCREVLPPDIDQAEQLHKILSHKAQEFCSVMLELVKLFSSYKSSSELLKQENALQCIQSQQNRINNLKDTVKSIQNTIAKYFLMSGTSLNNCFSIGNSIQDCQQDNLFNQTTDMTESDASTSEKYPQIDIDIEAATITNKPNWYLNEMQAMDFHPGLADYLFSNNEGRYERQRFTSTKR